MYAGHHKDGSSIQNHSAGPAYPYLFAVQEHVEQGIGRAQVLAPCGGMVYDQHYPLQDRAAKLKAWEAAIDMAEALAKLYREGLQ